MLGISPFVVLTQRESAAYSSIHLSMNLLKEREPEDGLERYSS